MEWIKLPYGMVQKMIEHVHFSKKRPENWNIKLTNKKDNRVKVYKDNKWIYKNKKDPLLIIEGLLDILYVIVFYLFSIIEKVN